MPARLNACAIICVASATEAPSFSPGMTLTG
jgi:hypothetical protein